MLGQWLITFTCRRCKADNTHVCSMDLNVKTKFPQLHCSQCERLVETCYEPNCNTALAIVCPVCGKNTNVIDIKYASDDVDDEEAISMPEIIQCEHCKAEVKV